MIRAAAKNFIRVAAVVDPSDYSEIVAAMASDKGCIPLSLRFRLAQKAFKHTADYDRAIAEFLGKIPFAAVTKTYPELNP
jgi:phosphoribosylaminoimidazolecarboxamide formyltransferase/IMP cyclohydrolase